jgi:hypothetical protein
MFVDGLIDIFTKRENAMRLMDGLMFAAMTLGTIGMTGCGAKPEPVVGEQVSDDHEGHDHDADDHASYDHSGWWCNEHGVPEEECALCDTSLVADFKAKGDWCDEHNRPESQCFTCDPERFNRFAARYEAKFGEKPPTPTE